VPGDTGDVPFRVQNVSKQQVEFCKATDVGSSDGDEDLAEDRFEEMVTKREEDYRAMAVGQLQHILDTYALKQDEDPKPKKPRRRK